MLPLGDEDLEEVWDLWCHSRTQMRYSFGMPAGLDYNAVRLVADSFGIEFGAYELYMLQALEFDLIREQSETAKAERKGKGKAVSKK